MTVNLAGKPLTEAELAILAGSAHGDTYAQIGRTLGYQEKSIGKMALRAARKLGARSITQAVHIATLRGLIGAHPDCGNRAAYLRHLRRGEIPCPACRNANADHAAQQRAHRKDAA
ncbi:LuxR C-terminal-related transcriptional regulator [Streptomyces sp. cg35]|uniref:LuxR C-terminal-related transcriptional regulator n=1 Tax=Streptomyces sp. cg35 TaxID=3421650 RepID=UPI003D173B0D